MTKIERLFERAIERRRDGRLSDRVTHVRTSMHSEAIYWMHDELITVRLAAHPRTALSAECGHDEPDLDIVIGREAHWDVSRLSRYSRPSVWLAGYRRAELRRAIAEKLHENRRARDRHNLRWGAILRKEAGK